MDSTLIGYIIGGIIGFILGMKVIISCSRKFIKDTSQLDKEKKRKRIMIISAIATIIGIIWIGNGIEHMKEQRNNISIIILLLGSFFSIGGIFVFFNMLLGIKKNG